MRTSLRRWLLHRRAPKMKPLIQRTSWGDFAFRMRRAIAIDIAIDLGYVRRSDLIRQQATKPLPVVDNDAPTVAAPPVTFYADETIAVPQAGVDEYATQPMAVLR